MLYRLLACLLVTAAVVAPAAAAPSRADGPASVAAAGTRPALQQPFDVLPLANGHLVVSDLQLGRVLDIDPARNAGRVIGTVRDARELDRLPNGRLLVSSRARVYSLDPATRKATLYATFRNYLLGIVRAPDGWLYGSENVPGSESTTIARIRGGVREVLVPELHGVHEMLWTDGTLVLCEAYGGRLLRLDPETKQVTVLATGMKNPSSAVVDPAGGYDVTEFFGDQISHVWPDGRVTKIAGVYKPGPLARDSKGRLVGASMSGEIWRIVRGSPVTIYG